MEKVIQMSDSAELTKQAVDRFDYSALLLKFVNSFDELPPGTWMYIRDDGALVLTTTSRQLVTDVAFMVGKTIDSPVYAGAEITTRTAASLAGVFQSFICLECRKGNLVSRRVGDYTKAMYLIKRADFDRWYEKFRPRRRKM